MATIYKICPAALWQEAIAAGIFRGLPIDLACYDRDTLQLGPLRRFDDHDPYMQRLRQSWGEGVRHAFAQLPSLQW